MRALNQYILFEFRRFFSNIKLVIIFFVSPLLATAVFALFAYQSPKNINIALVAVNDDGLTNQIVSQIETNELFKVHSTDSLDSAKEMLKKGEAKTIINIDIYDDKGTIQIIEDPRYPEVQGKVKEEVTTSVKEILKNTISESAKLTAKAQYQQAIDEKFVQFTDGILGQDADTPLSSTINSELDKIKNETISEINAQVDDAITENLESSKEELSNVLTDKITTEFGDFSSTLIEALPPGDVANTIASQLAAYRDELLTEIESTIAAEMASQMDVFKAKIKEELIATVNSKFYNYKNRLSPSNPSSPIYQAIKDEIETFKADLKDEEVDIAINTEPIELASEEYLPKEIRYFDRYSSGAIPLVIVLIFLLKAATSLSQDRESGVLERLFSTPAKRAKVMLAKIISNVLIGSFSLVAIIIMLKFAFGAALGNWGLVFLIAFIIAIVSVSMGMLISVITRDLPSSIQFAFYTFFMIVLTSEFFFAKENIHPYFSFATKINPLTYAISALRKVNLFNWGFREIWFELAIMMGFAITYSIVAIVLVSREKK